MNGYTGRRKVVRIVVVGDRGTGKSSLITTAATESFPETVPAVLPPTKLPDDFYPDYVPITIIDTSSSLEYQEKRNEELKKADAVVLTYACDESATITRLSTYWLREFRKLGLKVPVIVVGCKLDLRGEDQSVSLEHLMQPIMQQFREIETCLECSSATLIQVPEVFYYTQKAVLHPTAPLFDLEHQTLKDQCLRALRRIFTLCDHDMDGALSDAELNAFQIKCFNAPLQLTEIEGVKRIVQEKLPEGVNHLGLTLSGFFFLQSMFIDKGRLETTWAVLRQFGYDDDLKLRDDFIPVPTKLSPDQSVELTTEAVEFLIGFFRTFDTDKDRALRPAELDEMFSTAPESPWGDLPYKDAVETNNIGIALNGFLSQWSLMTLLDPTRSLAYLMYIGYNGDPALALRVTRRRSVDHKKQKTERNVFQCYVMGPKSAGKSALLDSLLGRPFKTNYVSTASERYAANVVNVGGNKKTLILREIPEHEVKTFLSNKNCLAACDVAVFVHDSSDKQSWKRSKELLSEVARHGEISGYRVPSLIIASKDDLSPCIPAVQDSVKVTQKMKMEAPIHISLQSDGTSNVKVFEKIVSVAECPHLNIPETELGRKQQQYHQLINHSLMFLSVGAAATVVGLAAFRAYAARKNSS